MRIVAGSSDILAFFFFLVCIHLGCSLYLAIINLRYLGFYSAKLLEGNVCWTTEEDGYKMMKMQVV